jgi:GxxExxY protein
METKMALEDARLLGSAMSGRIIQCAVAVHRAFGPGLLENAYRACLARELELAGFCVESEAPIPLHYRGTELACGFRADLIVDRKVLIELKAVERLLPIHAAQVLTYLKLTGIRVGLLVNFNTPNLRLGLRRLVL